MPKTILLADDDKSHLAMIEEVLKARGYAVITAKNGEEAVEKARRVRPDMAIFDVQMPVMDGDQAAMILKGDPETQSIPVLFLTGLRTEKEIEESHEDDILAKPVHVTLLLDKIRAMIGPDGAG